VGVGYGERIKDDKPAGELNLVDAAPGNKTCQKDIDGQTSARFGAKCCYIIRLVQKKLKSSLFC
jgi:hypothetical protein